jgi:hypothetical protein
MQIVKMIIDKLPDVVDRICKNNANSKIPASKMPAGSALAALGLGIGLIGFKLGKGYKRKKTAEIPLTTGNTIREVRVDA